MSMWGVNILRICRRHRGTGFEEAAPLLVDTFSKRCFFNARGGQNLCREQLSILLVSSPAAVVDASGKRCPQVHSSASLVVVLAGLGEDISNILSAVAYV